MLGIRISRTNGLAAQSALSLHGNDHIEACAQYTIVRSCTIFLRKFDHAYVNLYISAYRGMAHGAYICYDNSRIRGFCAACCMMQ